jgi:(2Fe-2S) ferredoxin
METNPTPYKRQIFVCVHNANGEKASCGDHKGEEVFRQLREIAKERKLHPAIRVAQAKCLGQCNTGVNIMIYPENIWHSGVRLEDVPQLAQKYIQ